MSKDAREERDRLAGVAAGAQGGRDSGLASRFDSGARPPTLFSPEAFAQIPGQIPFDSEEHADVRAEVR